MNWLHSGISTHLTHVSVFYCGSTKCSCANAAVSLLGALGCCEYTGLLRLLKGFSYRWLLFQNKSTVWGCAGVQPHGVGLCWAKLRMCTKICTYDRILPEQAESLKNGPGKRQEWKWHFTIKIVTIYWICRDNPGCWQLSSYRFWSTGIGKVMRNQWSLQLPALSHIGNVIGVPFISSLREKETVPL